MENDALNPYTPPESSLETTTNGQLSSIFERFSAWGVFGLMVITLGIYTLYWAFTRTQRLNAHTEDPIGAGFINTAIALYVIGLFELVTPYIGLDANFTMIISLLGLIGNIMVVVWIFKMRNRIHDIVGARKGDSAWFGPIKTFFFSAIYMQYKINSIIDTES